LAGRGVNGTGKADAAWQGAAGHGVDWMGRQATKQKGNEMTQEQQDYIRHLESRGGKLTPEQVLDAARPDESPLHGFFEWDDSAAAEAYRIEQARELIRRVRIEITYQETTIRTVQYVQDIGKAAAVPGYVNVMKPKGNAARAVFNREWEAVLALATRAFNITVAKAPELEGGAALVSSAERVLIEIQGMID
jgi:hypothetical protein